MFVCLIVFEQMVKNAASIFPWLLEAKDVLLFIIQNFVLVNRSNVACENLVICALCEFVWASPAKFFRKRFQ